MRVCLFCSSTNLTREHLWPGWIVQALKSNFSATQQSVHRRDTHTKTEEQVACKFY
jgi:hypothetical protein